jgi:membrane protein YdbS with pleckstrin-like domain
LDPEERKLQIKLAQLNANIQTSLAWIFGSVATGLTLFVLGYQVAKENFNVAIIAWIGTFVLICFAFGWAYRVDRYSDELEKLQ